jgi:hypothetical protein
MFRRQDALLLDIVRHRLLYHEGSVLRDGRPMLVFAGRTDPHFPDASLLAKHLHQQSASPVIAALCLGHLLHEGPKFFEFGARDCEALENFALDLSVEDYAQPFPTLMVKLPPDYAHTRVEHIRHFGHVPHFVIIHHDPTCALVLVSIRFRSGIDAAYHLSLDRPGRTVEEVWQEFRTDLRRHETEPLGDLCELAQSLARLALSACLMVMVYGSARVGPENPSHQRRLERHLHVARRSGDPQRAAAAAFDLQALPIRYEFAQEVRLYRVETPADTVREPGHTGRTMAPHWRRGHYRMQACGPSLSQRRRIAVAAVLVNSRLLVGDTCLTSVTYHS